VTHLAQQSRVDWTKIQNICFEDIDTINAKEEMDMTAFGAGGWLLITIIGIYMIVVSAMEAYERSQLGMLKRKGLTFDEGTARHAYLWFLVCVAVFVLLIPQFWTFFRLRRFQSEMTKAAGGKISRRLIDFWTDNGCGDVSSCGCWTAVLLKNRPEHAL
jgi:hypothetical protein